MKLWDAFDHGDDALSVAQDLFSDHDEGSTSVFEISIFHIAEIVVFFAVFGWRGRYLASQPRKEGDKTDEECGADRIKEGVCVGDLSWCFVGDACGTFKVVGLGGEGRDQAAKRAKEGQKQQDTEGIKEDVDDGDLAGFCGLAQTGDQSGDAGSDVGTERDGKASFEIEQPL